MRFLIFGTGIFYQKRKESLFSIIDNKDCIGYIDNFKNGDFEEKPIYNPYELPSIGFDFVIIMSGHAKDMYKQLIGLDIPEKKILLYDELIAEHGTGKLQIFPGNFNSGKRILIITHTLCYNGGAMAAIYAGMALQHKGYNVSIATGIIDRRLVDEVNKKGLSVIYCKAIPFIFPAECRWIEVFDIVLVNTFPMLPAAVDVSKFRPVLWWIHEPSMFYPAIANKYPNYFDRVSSFNGIVLAVSAIAEKNFNNGTSLSTSNKMFYGIPDMYAMSNMTYKKKDNVSFAIIGPVSDRKGQDTFVDAILRLPTDFVEKNQFIVIGADEDGDFSKCLHHKVDKLANFKFTGELSRSEMAEEFKQIDVVECPSREDPLPIVVTEGLMNKKICIISDAVGQAYDIIKDGENGFICKAGDAASLAEKMKFVISHFNELDDMREKARRTYEKYFSMEAFGNKLEQELLNTERTFLEKNIS